MIVNASYGRQVEAVTHLCGLKGAEYRSVYPLAAIFFEWRTVKALEFYSTFFISKMFDYFKQKYY